MLLTDSDLVIDDNVQGETVLGEGRSGLLDRREDSDTQIRQAMERKKAGTPRRGLSGPITSNLEVIYKTLCVIKHLSCVHM